MEDLQDEVDDEISRILSQQNDVCSNVEDITAHLRVLRNLCARGSNVQIQIASNENFQQFLQNLLFSGELVDIAKCHKNLHIVGWQLVANLIVNNEQTQPLIWKHYGEKILQFLCTLSELDKKVDVMLMIIYNVMKSTHSEGMVMVLVFRAVVSVWQSILEHKCSYQYDYLHFIFEEFLVNQGRNTVKFYAQLSTSEKLTFLDYLINYLRQESPNGLVYTFILQYIAKEFKTKSDYILRVASSQEVDEMKPQEAYALLKCIASASGSESYSDLFSKDYSLFLNISSLLRCLVAAVKDNDNSIFSPMKKLEEVAPTSVIPADYQLEISFELKTILVRCIANLLYNNDTNKRYCLDTQLLPALLECTNIDARNPLIKEWSILAIRNACIGCPEIQEVIANLSQQGPADSDILTELNLEMGSLRIKPSNK